MLRYYYINEEWMVSGTARIVHRLAATLSLLLFLLFIALPVAGEIPRYWLPALKLLLLAGVLGAAITQVAMEYFLFGFDRSGAWKKVFWFCVMLPPPLGAPLYCFIVYSRSEFFKAATEQKRVEGASA